MKKKIETKLVHGDEFKNFTGPVVFPIYQTSNFRFENSQIPVKYSRGDDSVYVYSRIHNPTINKLEKKLSAIYCTDDVALFSSGMAAISTAILSICKSHDELLSIDSLYGGTYHFFKDWLPKYGINVKLFSNNSLEDLTYLITPKTRIVYFEIPTNPTLKIIDISKLTKYVRKAEKEFNTKIIIIVDNTFSTVLNLNPFDYGIDLSIESTTKYLGGHSDLVGGLIAGPYKLLNLIKELRKYTGSIMEPFTSFLLNRSIKTLALRINRQNENAMKLAQELKKNKNVLRVIYPGLTEHPDHKLAKKQLKNFGAILTIEVKGGLKNAIKLCDNLKVSVNAMSLGGVETLVSIPVLSSHIGMSKSELTQQGVTDGMIRISCGIENISDLIEDFNQALSKIK